MDLFYFPPILQQEEANTNKSEQSGKHSMKLEGKRKSAHVSPYWEHKATNNGCGRAFDTACQLVANFIV